jgi:hypothetical protein
VHHGFNTCKLLLIKFVTNLLQDFFLGLEGKSSKSCFLPKERQIDRDCVGLFFVFGWNNSLWVLLLAILFSLALLGLMGFTVFLLMLDFGASSECWKWVVVVVLCRSQTWRGGGDMGQVCGLYQVDQSIVAVKEKFGKFSTVLSPGCHCVPWCCFKGKMASLYMNLSESDDLYCASPFFQVYLRGWILSFSSNLMF